jgi:protein tyrosine phosphatase (PTP) superfamily phosphohydrolase (DUF442 family)
MKRLSWLSCALAAGLLGAPGCTHFCRQSDSCASGYRCCDPVPVAGYLAPSPLSPCQSLALAGPRPPDAVNVLPRATPQPLPSTPPPPIAPAAPPEVQTGPPVASGIEPAWHSSPGPDVRLEGPETAQPPAAAVPQPQPGVAEERSGGPKPGVAEERTVTPSLPVGIPQFAMAKKRVASGQRPMLDGLDWLANHGYRTALHLHAPGQDDSSDRKQFEARGIRYVALEVSPQTLSREVVDQFNHLVTDAGSQPLFVYDKDGTLAGGLWYLHFRTAEGASDEDARAQAARLGLKEDSPEGRPMWLAVQNYLSGAGK